MKTRIFSSFCLIVPTQLKKGITSIVPAMLTIFIFNSKAWALNSQSYFKNNFLEAKTDFRGRAQIFLKENPKAQYSTLQIDTDDADMKIDYLFLPSEKNKNLIIFQSGMHGAEAHAGSGVQNFYLDYLHPKKLSQTSFLFIHGLNPYGFKNNRRANKNNVDLNRNFTDSLTLYQESNPEYEIINDFLNPKSVVAISFFSPLEFYASSVMQLIKHGMDPLKRAILKGQYYNEKGIYYGGKKTESETLAIISIWEKFVTSYENVLLVDIHTGYGARGQLHLLSHSSKGNYAQELTQFFEPHKIDFGDARDFYQTSGDSISLFQKKFSTPKRKVYSVAFEFGTMNSQSVLGAMKSLYRMVSENQGHQNGFKDEDSGKIVQEQFLDMFYPRDFEWRDRVIDQSKNELDKLITKLESP